MTIAGYDDWKTRSPYENQEDLATCIECGDEFDAEYADDADEDGAYRYLVHEVCGACEELTAVRLELASLELEAQGDGYTATEREAMWREIESLKRELVEVHS